MHCATKLEPEGRQSGLFLRSPQCRGRTRAAQTRHLIGWPIAALRPSEPDIRVFVLVPAGELIFVVPGRTPIQFGRQFPPNIPMFSYPARDLKYQIFQNWGSSAMAENSSGTVQNRCIYQAAFKRKCALAGNAGLGQHPGCPSDFLWCRGKSSI